MEQFPLAFFDEIEEGKFIAVNSDSNSEYMVIKLLNEGGFGKIYEVKDVHSGKILAMKTIMKSQKETELYECEVNIEREKYTLEITRGHPFLVGLECSFQTSLHFVLVMDYVSGLNMVEFFEGVEAPTPECIVRFYGAELCLALNFLHDKGIIHRDLKPENILIDFDGHIKLIDYGACIKERETNEETDFLIGTDGYIPCERYAKMPYNCSVDWYAFGIILYMLLANDHPLFKLKEKPNDWKLPSDEEKRLNLVLGGMGSDVLSYPEHLSFPARSLLEGLLSMLPEYRLGQNGFHKIKEHEFFADVEWDKIEKKELPAPWKNEVRIKMNTPYYKINETEKKDAFEDFNSSISRRKGSF